MAINKLIITSILVENQEEALKFYCGKLGFEKRIDLPIPGSNDRFLTIAPNNQKEIEILLRRPRAGENELVIQEMNQKIGKGSLWTFSTNDCQETYKTLLDKGVEFKMPPTKSINGMEAVFVDLYGNRFTLLEVPR